ncbi:uncharacterized protein LOC129146150, partial [Talpa occidentalis]|uniref:uncharacterized protein LOC129146150 n=1 Tax=Talpa occidentalis TaxID=50954 RepID=UPI0023F86D16
MGLHGPPQLGVALHSGHEQDCRSHAAWQENRCQGSEFLLLEDDCVPSRLHPTAWAGLTPPRVRWEAPHARRLSTLGPGHLSLILELIVGEERKDGGKRQDGQAGCGTESGSAVINFFLAEQPLCLPSSLVTHLTSIPLPHPFVSPLGCCAAGKNLTSFFASHLWHSLVCLQPLDFPMCSSLPSDSTVGSGCAGFPSLCWVSKMATVKRHLVTNLTAEKAVHHPEISMIGTGSVGPAWAVSILLKGILTYIVWKLSAFPKICVIGSSCLVATLKAAMGWSMESTETQA